MASPSFPPLPPELVAFTERGVSILVGTCSRALVPDCVRGCGVRVWPGACQATVLMPVATSVQAIANLRENPRIGFTLCHMPTHETVQIKGAVLGIRDGNDDERAIALAYREAFAVDLAWVGQSKGNGLRFSVWPCHAIDVEIGVVYHQTPGPSAGIKMPLPAGQAS